ncbi:choice-of-anchor G family protein, partial [Isoptericola sp. BMS4]|uniref:choice-of-anchor G family protein n=1 Tax=Isoptericola sp. BMS4 TaxID=2527875 RepID=UPI00141F0E52
MFASAGVLGVATFGGITAASAAPTDDTEAQGTFLGGTVLGTNLDDIAELEGALAENPSGESLDTNPLAAEVLNAIEIDLGDGISLLGENSIASVGTVNQYASATADSADAASGAVSDQGAIEVGGSEEFPANATIGLTELLGDLNLEGIISEAELTLGAVSSEAHWPAGGEPTGDYQIASATIDLESPLVGGLLGPVLNLVGALLGDGVGQADVDGVFVDLATGEVSIDLAAVLASQGLDINDLDPDTELLSGEVLNAVTTGLVNSLTEALGSLLALDLGPVTDLVDSLLGDLTEEVVSPLLDGVNDLISLKANVQDQPGDIAAHDPSGTESFTQRALQLTLLPGDEPLAQINLASSSVRTFVEDGEEVDGTEVDGTEVDGTEVDGTEVDGT